MDEPRSLRKQQGAQVWPCIQPCCQPAQNCIKATDTNPAIKLLQSVIQSANQLPSVVRTKTPLTAAVD